MSEHTTTDEQDPVLYEVADHVATITLNRPHRRNAISVKMLQQLGEVLTEADDSRELKPFLEENRASVADDHTGAPVFLARNAWHLERAEKDYPQLRFLRIKEQAPS